MNLVELATELSTIDKTSTTTGRVAQNRVTSGTGNDGLSVAVDGRNLVARLTLDIHEEGIGALNEALLLVLKLLGSKRRVQQISDQLQKKRNRNDL